uniref:Uncharacterized protein n=1 Tax=Kalanchoe fedtschenkoi TaxID=63787 RepID=A0A7N0TKQ1_KALFE
MLAVLSVCDVRFQCCLRSLSSRSLSTIRGRALTHYKEKVDNWNTDHSFVRSNPLLALLEKCSSITHLLQVQTQMTTTGLVSDPLALSRLIAFCALSAKGRDLNYCTKMLRNAANANVFSWNIAMRGCLESECAKDAVFLYNQMLRAGGFLRPDNYTFPLLFKACACLAWSWVGVGAVGHVVKLGFESDVFVHNGMLHMLVSCGRLEDARQVFDGSSVRDLVSWNSLINGYVRSGKAGEALEVYRDMELEEVEPDEVTMIGVVSSCAQLVDLNTGRYFHRLVNEKGLNLTVPLANALMDMYVKCGELTEARAMFDNMEKKTTVSWTTIVAGYAKLGFFETARQILDAMPEKDIAPWNAIISGYVQAKRSKEALALFNELQSFNVRPDEVTMVTCLSACSQLGALDVGIWINQYIERNKFPLNVTLGTALVDMYAKCGNIVKAVQVFSQIPAKNSLTWTALICGLALHGKSSDAIFHFSMMINVGLIPDEVTFLGLLTACCHSGSVKEGREFFSQMTKVYRLSPKLKHYSCMVDLLGKAGLLDEAEELINSMPMQADAVVWAALFSACRMHKNVALGEKAAFKLLGLDPHDSATYVSLADLYNEANMWEHARKVRNLMKDNGVEKTPGCSSIEVNGNVFEFIVRDKGHPETDDIYNCLVQLTRQLRPTGGVFRVHDILIYDFLGNMH